MGLDGENVIGSGTTNYPTYAQVTVTGNATTTTWAASTTNVRALELHPAVPDGLPPRGNQALPSPSTST